MKWIASSILFQSTALAGTLAGVPIPFYSRGYTRAYAAVSCDSSVKTETASNIDESQFQQRNGDVSSQTISCTIGSGTLTTAQYAYGGPYMSLYNVGDGGGSDTYRGTPYGVHSNWAWSGFGVKVTNNATIAVTEASDTQLLFSPGGSITLGDLRTSDTQYNALGVVSLGALNWSDTDDNKKTGGGNGGAVTIVSSGDVSSTVGGGIFALSQGGTNQHADDIGEQYSGQGSPVTVKSYGKVSGSSFGIAALSIGGPSTYSSDSDFSGPGGGDYVSVYAGGPVYATKSGPAILAASYGGNTPYNVNSFGDGVQGGNGGNSYTSEITDWQKRPYYNAVKVQVGSTAKPMAGTISTRSAGTVNLWLNNQNIQLTRETGAAIAAITRGGNGLAGGDKQAMDGGSVGQAAVYIYGSSATTIQTSGTNSPGILAISQGGTSYQSDKDDNERLGGRASSVTVTVTGGGTIDTKAGYSSGIIAQSLGGGGTSTFKQTKGMGGAAGAVTVSNDFAITTTGDHAHGIVAQSASAADGDGIYTNTGSGALTWGDTSSSGSTSSDVTVTNSGNITAYGIDSHGIVAQSIGGGGGLLQSTGTISTTSYSAGSAVSDPSLGQTIGGQTYGSSPATVTVTNKGNISTYGGYAGAKTPASSSDQTELGGGIAILAQSIGGGGGTNSGTGATGAIGAGANSSLAVSSSSSGTAGSDGGAVHVTNYANLTTAGSEAHGIVAQSIGGGGGQGRNKKGLFHTVGGAGGGGGGLMSWLQNRGH